MLIQFLNPYPRFIDHTPITAFHRMDTQNGEVFVHDGLGDERYTLNQSLSALSVAFSSRLAFR